MRIQVPTGAMKWAAVVVGLVVLCVPPAPSPDGDPSGQQFGHVACEPASPDFAIVDETFCQTPPDIEEQSIPVADLPAISTP